MTNASAQLYTLTNNCGTKVTIMDVGATLVDFRVFIPKINQERSVILGTCKELYSHQQLYMGATIGRFANRIANGLCTIEGVQYHIETRKGEKHSLHSGDHSFDKRVFEVVALTPNSITLTTHSPHLDQGFPGDVTLIVTYTLDDTNGLKITYEATTTKATPLNITNHAYWNLNGDADSACASNFGHEVTIPADFYLPLDNESIPTGEFKAVDGTIFDLRNKVTITPELLANEALKATKGYDHPYILNKNNGKDGVIVTSADKLLQLSVKTDYPAVHFYTANYFTNAPTRRGNESYHDFAAIAIEPEYYPNFVNEPNFTKDCPLVTPEKPLKKFIYNQIKTI